MGVKLNPFTGKLDVVDSPSGDFSTVELNQGTQTSPSISFDGDPNTGIYSPGADQLAISTSGTGRLFVDSSGRVGIGTSSPQYKTQVFGGSDSQENVLLTVQSNGVSNTGNLKTTLRLANSTSPSSIHAADISAIRTTNAEALAFSVYNGGSGTEERMRIDSSGRVGIGTTSPDQLLDLKQITGDTMIQFYSNTGFVSRLQVTGSDTFAINTGYTERLRIDSSGRLLVGLSSSSGPELLSVQGQSSNSTAGGGISIKRGQVPTSITSGAGIGNIYFEASDGSRFASFYCQADGTAGSGDYPGRLVFSTTADGASSPTERLLIDSSGRVRTGGTTSTLSGNGWYVEANGQANYRTATTGNAYIFRSGTSSVGSISVSTTNTSFNTSSDYRLKENVTAVTDGITRLQQLKPSRFNFIADPDTTVDGFIAHEVQTIVPEAITGEKDAVDDDGNAVYQGIDQSKLVPLLTAALQEAIAKIETLEQRLNDAGIA